MSCVSIASAVSGPSPVNSSMSAFQARRILALQLNKLMTGAKQRQFDAVLVWKLDRFGRSLKHLVTALGEFEALGIAFVSLRDSFDLTTPAGRLMFNMVASFAEFERDLIRERVKAGIANRRAKGFHVGRKPRLRRLQQAPGSSFRGADHPPDRRCPWRKP